MEIYKKILIAVLFLGVISGGVWYARQIEAPTVGNPDNDQVTGEIDGLSGSSGSDSNADLFSVLKSEAEKIIARPLPVGASELVIKKLNESIDAIKSNYNYANPWHDLASYRKISGDNQGAIEAWNFLIKIRPDDYITYHNLGDMYAFTLKNYLKGAEYFSESIEKNPKNVDAYIQLGSILEFHLKERYAESEQLFLSGIKNNPGNVNLTLALAQYYKNIGNKESAKIYFEKALEIKPGDADIEAELKSLGY